MKGIAVSPSFKRLALTNLYDFEIWLHVNPPVLV
jgi:hypothetical protein